MFLNQATKTKVSLLPQQKMLLKLMFLLVMTKEMQWKLLAEQETLDASSVKV